MQDCSPTFFMISGALLLEKDESIGDIYKKRVSRIFAALLIFSLFQYSRQISNNTAPAQLSYFIEHFYTDSIIIPYWFLYQYISFLIILPFLRKMVRRMERRDYIYLMLIWLFLEFFKSLIIFLTDKSLTGNISCALLSLSIFYPLMGDFLENKGQFINKTKTILVFGAIISVTCVLLSSIFTWYEIKKTGDLMTQRWLGVFVAVPTVFIFFSVKTMTGKMRLSQFSEKIICLIGGCTFGIYLFEGQLRSLFLQRIVNILTPHISSFLACLLGIPIIILIGTMIVYCLKRIPVINKFL